MIRKEAATSFGRVNAKVCRFLERQDHRWILIQTVMPLGRQTSQCEKSNCREEPSFNYFYDLFFISRRAAMTSTGSVLPTFC